MGKDPSPRADALRAQRESRYGHLQAKATKMVEQAKSLDYGKSSTAAMIGMAAVKLETKAKKKLIAYAGKETKGIAPPEKKGHQTDVRKRVKRKRRTELPPAK